MILNHKLHRKTIEQYLQTLGNGILKDISLLNDLVPGQKMQNECISLKNDEWTKSKKGKFQSFNGSKVGKLKKTSLDV
jgi:hypothetical protein